VTSFKYRGVYSGHFPPPPWRGGGKKEAVSEFGEENRPREKKISEVKNFLILLEKLFSITTLAFKSNTKKESIF